MTASHTTTTSKLLVTAAFTLAGLGFAVPVGHAQSTTGNAAVGAPAKAAKAAPAGGDSGLRQRVEQLEEQLIDLQVVIGTLESLARSGGGAPGAAQANRPPLPLAAADGGRLNSLEAQVRALSQQVEQLSHQTGQGPAVQNMAPPAATETSRFGSTTVTSATGDPIGGLLSDSPPSPPPGPAGFSPAPVPSSNTEAVATAPLEPAGNPKQAYEAAYGYLLQQDFGAAQAGFTDFLKAYPNDPLVPNALYWLGETHYVQKNFSDAAEAFDIVIQAYGSSSKAPDSLLKRGMSLAQLGKRDDACTALRQVAAKYPTAAQQVKSKADSERQRIGCP